MSIGRNIASIFNMWNGVKSNDPLLKKEKKLCWEIETLNCEAGIITVDCAHNVMGLGAVMCDCHGYVRVATIFTVSIF